MMMLMKSEMSHLFWLSALPLYYIYINISCSRPQTVADFLEKDSPPARSKIPGKGLFFSMRESLDARRGSSAIDPDEFFQKEREWAAEYGSQLRDVCDRFQSMLNSQLRLANQGRLRCVRFMQHVKNL